MLKIRLQRTGRKHEPTFRIVVTESQNSTKSGRALEVLGSYDARKSNEIIHEERVKYWISKGAQASDTMHNMLVHKKIIEGKKVNPLPRKKPIIDQAKIDAEAKAAAEKAEKEAAEAEAAKTAAETPAVEEPIVEAESATSSEAEAETPAIEEAPAEDPQA
jgi:small subunit ribosomal protein S16